MHNIFIIAEAGVNHNGRLDIAKIMVDVAKKAGADAVKFQSFKADNVVSKFAGKAEYQKKRTMRSESQLEMIKELELSLGAHIELIKYCREKGIAFLSSPFDVESVDMLDRLGLKIFKIPSGEITNLPLLRKIGSLGRKVILSTGMSNLKEINAALYVLIKEGTRKRDITVLHCVTEYPALMQDVNLMAMCTMRTAFKVNVGYSDHTRGIEIPIAAAAIGARVIEKHFTLDRNMVGPDHEASVEPEELNAMIRAIRNVEKAIGNGDKKPTRSELKNKVIVRKSIVALRDIRRGELFTESNITTKRPATGLSPMVWDKVIGRKASMRLNKDEAIKL